MPGLLDIVVIHAIRHGLDPGSSEEHVAAELADLARASRSLLERALGRIELGLLDRPSRVGHRARDALRTALALIERGEPCASG